MNFNTFSFESRIGNRNFPLKLKRMEPQDPTELHNHEFSELVIIYKGEGIHYSKDGCGVRLAAGSIFVVPQGDFYHKYGEIKDLCLVNILFENSHLPMPLLDVFTMPGFNMLFNRKNSPSENIRIFQLSEAVLAELLTLANNLEAVLRKEDAGYRFMGIAIFMQIIYLVSKSVGGSLESVRTPGVSMGRAIGYLHRHFTETDVSIEKLASALNMSMSSLLRHFRRQNGCSPKEYLLKLRIRCACDMLQDGDLCVSEIATRSGFDDSNYFSRQFKKVTGLSPREFRELSERIVNA